MKAFSGYIFPPESLTYLPNPHIQHHGCIGANAMRFQEYMQKKDYVGAINQAVISARNINFFDSAAVSNLGSDLSSSGFRCLERPDGKLLSPLEAIIELERGAECPDR